MCLSKIWNTKSEQCNFKTAICRSAILVEHLSMAPSNISNLKIISTENNNLPEKPVDKLRLNNLFEEKLSVSMVIGGSRNTATLDNKLFEETVDG